MKPQHEGEKLLCLVCELDLSEDNKIHRKEKRKDSKRGVILIQREGTGFSSGGKAVATKSGVAFQA